MDQNNVEVKTWYEEVDGRNFKMIVRTQMHNRVKWTNTAIEERKKMAKFGKAAEKEKGDEDGKGGGAEPGNLQEVKIELAQQRMSAKDEEEDNFYKESLGTTESLNKTRMPWVGTSKLKAAEKEEEATSPRAVTAPAAPKSGTYMPPSLRGKDGNKGEGKGRGIDFSQECSLRVTNLSVDAKEGDLQDLFGQCGRLQRVYLARDQFTSQSRGFAFVTYYNREDALQAIKKLHGHGYDNLILQVQFAKPRN